MRCVGVKNEEGMHVREGGLQVPEVEEPEQAWAWAFVQVTVGWDGKSVP